MDAPQYQPPPTDPEVTALDAQAATADQTAMQNQAQMDTASIMSRYGTRLAMTGTVQPGSPLAVVPPAAAAPGVAGMVQATGLSPTQFMQRAVGAA